LLAEFLTCQHAQAGSHTHQARGTYEGATAIETHWTLFVFAHDDFLGKLNLIHCLIVVVDASSVSKINRLRWNPFA
jgi:hypothetical protein